MDLIEEQLTIQSQRPVNVPTRWIPVELGQGAGIWPIGWRATGQRRGEPDNDK
jgi:hypothetical protein